MNFWHSLVVGWSLKQQSLIPIQMIIFPKKKYIYFVVQEYLLEFVFFFVVPVSVLILGANQDSHNTFYPDKEGAELCHNITYLGMFRFCGIISYPK